MITNEEAIKRIKDFGLYHAIEDLPNSHFTVEAFKMAIQALEENTKLKAEIEKLKETNAKLRKAIEDNFYGSNEE